MTLKRVQTTDRNLQAIQDNVDQALVPIERAPLQGGAMLKAVTLTAAQDNLVAHTLDHTPSFFVITYQNSNSNVWTQTSSSLSNQIANSKYLNLRCSANCIVSLWVN